MQLRSARRPVGIGLRHPHIAEVLARRPADLWYEVHAENFMYNEEALTALLRIRENADIALHGVALSLGSAEPLNHAHLERLARLTRVLDPIFVSEHLAWCSIDGRYLNDLLPLPYTDESLGVVCEHVSEAQDVLQRALLVENPARYLAFRHSAIPEDEFLRELSARTGCGLLCDVNNVHVSAFNLGFDAVSYLHSLPAHAVREIHLAGHALVNIDGRELLIDDHGSRVKSQVWCLYAEAVQRFGNVPTLIEWDNDLPDLDVLLSEADKARTCQTEISPERQDGKRTSKIVPSPI